MADPSIVKEWLTKAEDDFRFAESNLKRGSQFCAQICFHFQQAAEKYLKSILKEAAQLYCNVLGKAWQIKCGCPHTGSSMLSIFPDLR